MLFGISTARKQQDHTDSLHAGHGLAVLPRTCVAALASLSTRQPARAWTSTAVTALSTRRRLRFSSFDIWKEDLTNKQRGERPNLRKEETFRFGHGFWVWESNPPPRLAIGSFDLVKVAQTLQNHCHQPPEVVSNIQKQVQRCHVLIHGLQL